MERVDKARKNKKKNKEVESFQLLPLKDLDEKDYLYGYLYFSGIDSWNLQKEIHNATGYLSTHHPIYTCETVVRYLRDKGINVEFLEPKDIVTLYI